MMISLVNRHHNNTATGVTRKTKTRKEDTNWIPGRLTETTYKALPAPVLLLGSWLARAVGEHSHD